jgi:hypothetical protein
MADNGATFMPALKISTQEQFIRSFIETANHFPFCHRLNDCRPCALASYLAVEYPAEYLKMMYLLATGQEFQLTTAEAGGANVHTCIVAVAAKFLDMLPVIDFYYRSRLVGLSVMSLLEADMREWAAAGYFLYQGIQESVLLMFSRTAYLRMERRDDGLLLSNFSQSLCREDFWKNTLRLCRSEPLDFHDLTAKLIHPCGFTGEMATAIVAKAAAAIVKLYVHSKTPEGAPYIVYATQKCVTELQRTISVVTLPEPEADRDALAEAKFFVVFPGVYSLLRNEIADFSIQLGLNHKYAGAIVRMTQIEIANCLLYSNIVPGKNRDDAYVKSLSFKNDDPLRLGHYTYLSNLLQGTTLKDNDITLASLAEIKEHIPNPGRGRLFQVSTAYDANNLDGGGHMSLAHVQMRDDSTVSVVYSNGVTFSTTEAILSDSEKCKPSLVRLFSQNGYSAGADRFGPVVTELSFANTNGKLRARFSAFCESASEKKFIGESNFFCKYCSLNGDLRLIAPFASVAVVPTTFVAVPAPLPAADGGREEVAEEED